MMIHAELAFNKHPDNVKRGGGCFYYKESLPISVISLRYLKEALLLGMTYNNEKVIVSVIYRSTSQDNSEFDSFLSNFVKRMSDISKCKPYLSVIAGDFNARSSSW